MKKWYILVALVVVLGILVAIPAPEVTTTDYSQIEQVAKKAIREGTSDIHNFDIKVSKDDTKVVYECSEADIPMTIGEVTGVYAGIVDYAPEVGSMSAYAYNSNGQLMASYYCLNSWAKNSGVTEQASQKLVEKVFDTISWY